MAVVINDFEVVTEEATPAAAPAAAPSAPTTPQPCAPTPQEFELAARRLRERAERVRAD
jgi:hypothetical protein